MCVYIPVHTFMYISCRVDYEHVIKADSTCLAARLNLALLQQCEGKHMLAWQSVSDLLEHHRGTKYYRYIFMYSMYNVHASEILLGHVRYLTIVFTTIITHYMYCTCIVS